MNINNSILLFLVLCACSLSGCRLHPRICDRAPVSLDSTYCEGESGLESPPCCWWEAFEDATLNALVEEALLYNYDVAQAWDRLLQARAETVIAEADQYPAANLDAGIARSYTDGRISSFTGGTVIGMGSGSTANSRYLLGTDISYELDLWQRISSKARAACYNFKATREDLEATALTISGTVADLYFTIVEQKALLGLLQSQIEVSRTFLELTELRFRVGQSSALDVYQQSVQLKQTEAEVPPVETALKNAQHQLSVVLGYTPKCCENEERPPIPDLPAFPYLDSPCALLLYRPDLRASYFRLHAADEEIASAVADRFPKITLRFDYDFSALTFNSIFDRMVIALLADSITPIFDAGKRAAEVDRRKAITYERFHSFAQNTLTAVREVEDAISDEKLKLELIAILYEQKDLSRKNLREARSRYVNGLVDYLTVIAAIQSLQGVERRIVSEEIGLLVNRAKLYRALGGAPLECCHD